MFLLFCFQPLPLQSQVGFRKELTASLNIPSNDYKGTLTFEIWKFYAVLNPYLEFSIPNSYLEILCYTEVGHNVNKHLHKVHQ